eukprot:1845040-Pyramimonas_sp.AAC.1
MQQRYPRTRWRAFRIKGEMHADSVPMVKTLRQADPPIVQWNDQAANRPKFQRIDRGNIITSFQALFAETETAARRSYSSLGP